MIQAGIIGLGVGERHIGGYERHPECRVTRLADFCPTKRADVRTRFPDREIADNADAVLDDPDVSIVSIASHDQDHFAQVMRALDADKHVFVEKPLVLEIDHARQIRAKLNQKPHLKISSNLILRRCPRFLKLRADIAAGDYGRLFHIDADYQYGRIHKLLGGWRGELPGYSLVLGGAVHMIDLVLWLTGDRAVEVTAMGNRIATADSAFANFDLVQALVRFESGMVAKIGCNGGCVHPHFHKLEVYGTNASFVNGLESAFVYRDRHPGRRPETMREAYPGVDKGDLLHDFVDAVLHDRAPEVSADDVFRSLAVCFAIERAAHTGKSIAVEQL
ncbi:MULTISPECIES: Gfo/Idh/MocA family oxidoreductase [unclassified Minwuia]|jgi:predicted dehydrogenase|uniref:Gfo/Idh/MocA family protein n=1 Tax=unclassified Minwuia TaxID=2618799 RepID=UPI00247A4231|nr:MULTISPECIES: Gfo/Idh/MocA family oxidoreductase [unclassified Minwuia]